MSATPRIQRILVVRMGHIGDVVLVTPALDALRAMFPDASISMLVRAGTEVVLANDPRVTRVFTGGDIVSQQQMHVQTRSSLGQRIAKIPRGIGVAMDIRREHFDLMVDFTSGDRSAIMGFVGAIPIRVGFAARGHGLAFRDRLYTHLCDATAAQHKVTRDAALLREVARATGRSEFTHDHALELGAMTIHLAPADVEWARNRWESIATPGTPRVVMHPTSRVLYKCWAADHWGELIDRVIGDYRATVVVTSGPDEREKEIAKRTIALRPLAHPHFGDLTIGRLAALIQYADLFIGVDTAPMHIAAAVGTPVVAIFGPSDDSVWGPWGDNHYIVRRPCACLTSGTRGCDEAKGMTCLRELTSASVYEIVRVALQTG